MIRFEHSVFALPFALAGAWLAGRGLPPLSDLAWIVLAAVTARSAAMAFNRILDRGIDAENPRTAERELVTGVLDLRFAWIFTSVNAAVFLAASFMLAPICGWLAFPVLAVLFGYSLLKRFTLFCHFGLGLALACAPAGAWLAVAKDFQSGWDIPLWIGGGVMAWVAGFDLLYAIQDENFDRRAGLRSIPVRMGATRARALSALLFVLAIALWAVAGDLAELSWPYAAGLAGCAGLMLIEHLILRGDRLDRIPLAFFTVNSWVGVVYFAGLLAALGWEG
ncbi:MAG: putative 4-hydroxybenzoate polyprenyltransferase [Planctomycetes bacterium]|nr:putative 4-hydroxybenzoate polyprenyltransferase [Planctomycetota bacterium]